MRLQERDLLIALDMAVYRLVLPHVEARKRGGSVESIEKRLRQGCSEEYWAHHKRQNNYSGFFHLHKNKRMYAELRKYVTSKSAEYQLPTLNAKFGIDGIPALLAVYNYAHREIKHGLELRRVIRQSQVTAHWLHHPSNTRLYHFEPRTKTVRCIIVSGSENSELAYNKCLRDFEKRLERPGDNFAHALSKRRFGYTILVPDSTQNNEFEQLFEERGFPGDELVSLHKVSPATRELFQVEIEPALCPEPPTKERGA